MYCKGFSKRSNPFIFKILALTETYTWDVQVMGWIGSWEGGRGKMMEPLCAPGHKHKDNAQLSGRPGTDSCRERIQNGCDDGISWVLPFVFRLHVLESFFLSTTWFCFCQWYEVFLLTVFWHLSHLPFFLLYTAWIFFVSSVLLFFWPGFVPCLFLHKFILVAGLYIKYCRNRMFLWNVIKDRMWTADILVFSQGKKGGKLFHCMSILDESCAGQKPGGAVTPYVPQRLHSSQARTRSILEVTFPLEWGQKTVSFGKVFQSFSGKCHALVGPLQQPGFLWDFNSFSHQSCSLQGSYGVHGRSCTHRENFLWAWLWQRCVDGGVKCMWSLRTRQNQIYNLWIYKWKRRMKNWTRSKINYEQFGRHWGILGVPRLLNRSWALCHKLILPTQRRDTQISSYF